MGNMSIDAAPQDICTCAAVAQPVDNRLADTASAPLTCYVITSHIADIRGQGWGKKDDGRGTPGVRCPASLGSRPAKPTVETPSMIGGRHEEIQQFAYGHGLR